jgi:hypothetical protein
LNFVVRFKIKEMSEEQAAYLAQLKQGYGTILISSAVS